MIRMHRYSIDTLRTRSEHKRSG